MTAPEPTPTAEHIDAVARNGAIDAVARALRPWVRVRGKQWTEARMDADRLLTSTDPAMHAAMLDALVRAGVLTPEDAPIYRGAEHHHWQQRWDGMHTHEGHRFVTPWEVAE